MKRVTTLLALCVVGPSLVALVLELFVPVKPMDAQVVTGYSTPGASLTLNNLTSPTAINQTLTFNNGLGIGISAGNNSIINGNGTNINGNGSILIGTTLGTGNICTSASGTCGSAPAGQVTIAAAATTVTVSTTAVHTGSQIFLGANTTLGTALSVTCNTTAAFGQLEVTTITNNTSFVITISAAPTTNPECIQYFIIN